VVAAAAFAIGLSVLGAPGIERFFDQPPSVPPQFLSHAAEKPPQRIVTVAPSVTELVFALGAGDRIVGVSRYDDHPASVRALPKVGGFLDPNPEAILALRPDLVVGVPNAGNRPALDRIAKLGVSVLVVPGNSLADVFHATRALAPVLGGDAQAKAENLEHDMKKELEALARAIAAAEAPRVAWVYGRSPLILAGPNSFADAILTMLNAKNIVTSGPAYPQYSIEKLVLDRPDVILDASEEHDDGAAPWLRFSTIPAVKNHRVFALQLDEILRPGPRLVDGMKKVAKLLHP
jgi:iron complex transport system substrate-binding protein